MDPQQRILDQRYVDSEDLAQNLTLLDGCPHRYVFVAMRKNQFTLAPAGGALPLLLWCVEMLETRGWEPVAWELSSDSAKGVLMRRRAPTGQ
jgi:hypothetical protein